MNILFSAGTFILGFLLAYVFQNELCRRKKQEKNAEEKQNKHREEIAVLNRRAEDSARVQKAQTEEISSLKQQLAESQGLLTASRERNGQENDAVSRIHEALSFGAWTVWYDKSSIAFRVEWSDNLRRLLGYTDTGDFPNTLEAFIGAIHPDDVLTVLAATQVDVHSREDRKDGYSIRLRMRQKNGEYRWYRNSAQAVRRADGSVSLFCGILMDITGIEKTESELQEALEFIQAANKSLGAANWKIYCTLDGYPSGCVWGDALRSLIGYTVEEFPDTIDAWKAKLHPDDKKSVFDSYWETVRKPGCSLFKTSFRLQTKDRSYRRFEAFARLTRNPDGSPNILYGYFMDADEKKTAVLPENA